MRREMVQMFLVSNMVTKLVETKFKTKQDGKILIKLESENPTGSIKDRMASKLLSSLLASGKINKDTVVVEASSGNTGIALAAACQKLGLKLLICMAATVQQAKQDKIKFYGADVKTFDNTKNSEAEIDAARDFGEKPGYYFINQFENQLQVAAYQESVGVELLSELDSAINNLVMGIGTGALVYVAENLIETEGLLSSCE